MFVANQSKDSFHISINLVRVYPELPGIYRIIKRECLSFLFNRKIALISACRFALRVQHLHLFWPESERIRVWLSIDDAIASKLRPDQADAMIKFKSVSHTLL